MPFPYSQTQKIVLERSEYQIDTLPDHFDTVLLKAIQSKGIIKKDNWFVSNNSLFSIPFKFQVKSFRNHESLKIYYKLHLHNLVNGVLVINILTAFFSKFQFETYLWFILFASMVFYGLSLLIIRAGLKNMTLSLFQAYKHENNIEYLDGESEINYSYQEESKLLCPACRSVVESEDMICKSCGIKLKQNPFTKPLEL